MESVSRSKQLIECALFCSISVVLFLTVVISPPIGVMLIDFSIIPITISAIRYGFRHALISVLSASLIIMMFSGYDFGILYFLSFGLIGLTIGVSIQKKHFAATTMILGTVVSLSAIAFFFFTAASFSSISEIVFSAENTYALIEQFHSALNKMVDLQHSFNVITEPQTIQYKAMFAERIDVIKRSIPSIIMMVAFLRIGILYVITFHILKRFRMIQENKNTFSQWRISWKWAAALSLGGALFLLDSSNTHAMLRYNYLYCFQILLFCYTLAILTYFLIYFKIPVILRIVVYVCSFYISDLIYIIGLLDCFFNFRQYCTKKEEK